MHRSHFNTLEVSFRFLITFPNTKLKEKVSFGSVDVSEDFSYKGEVKSGWMPELRSFTIANNYLSYAIANHLIQGKDYAIASVHYLDSQGNISENGNINANEEGYLSKNVKDDVTGKGAIYTAYNYLVSAKGNVVVKKKVSDLIPDDVSPDDFPEDWAIAGVENNAVGYELYAGNVEGNQALNSHSASQNVNGEGYVWAETDAAKYENGEISELAGSAVYSEEGKFNANGWSKTTNGDVSCESYMEGYGNYNAGGSLTGYAYAEVDGSSADDNVDINDVNYSLHAWIEDSNPYAEVNP